MGKNWFTPGSITVNDRGHIGYQWDKAYRHQKKS